MNIIKRLTNSTKGLLSISEQRISTIIIAFLTFCGFSLYILMTTKDIPNNLKDLLETFLFVIGGVNLPHAVGSAVTAYNSLSGNQTPTDTTDSTQSETQNN
jgi:hypothetical protein